MSNSPIKQLEGTILDLMQQFKIPGLSIGIIKGKKSLYSRGFGARDLEQILPMTPDTLFGIGSISKSFVALSVMQLVEQGKIDLQAPVSNYIDFKLGKEDNPILIHHLLSHSSGISDLDTGAIIDYRLDSMIDTVVPIVNWDEFMHYVNGASGQIAALPGTVFMYSNDMFSCLAYIVETVSGMKYAEFIKSNILSPLKMKRSTYEFKNADNIETGYKISADGKKLEATTHPFHEIKFGRGGLFSSTKEMQNYMIMLLNGGNFPSDDIQIIQESSLKKMWSPHMREPEDSSYSDAYCYGWTIEKDFFGHVLISHGGSIGTTGGFLGLIPDLKLGIVIGQNGTPAICQEITRGIFATFLGKGLSEAVPLLGIHEKISKLEGKYVGYKGLTKAEVKLQNGLLGGKIYFVGNPNPMTFTAAPSSIDALKFYVPVVYPKKRIWIQFTVDEKTGQVHLQADRYYLHKI